MEYRIRDKREDVAITVTDVSAPQQDAVLAALQECAEGRCSCPTQQYGKVESLKIERSDAGVVVAMKLKAGETIDRSDIERCLDYTLDKASKV